MIKPETLDFPPLHCSLDPESVNAGLLPAIALVEGGYHGGIDEHGVATFSIPSGTYRNQSSRSPSTPSRP